MIKRCSKCKAYKDTSLFYKHRGKKDGHCCQCITCTKLYVLNNLEKCREIKRQSSKRFRLKNPKNDSENSRRWRLNNKDKVREAKMKKTKKERDHLHDTYIKNLISSHSLLRAEDLSKNYIQLIREHVRLGRLIKEMS